MTTVYLDASAITKLVILEPESVALRRFLQERTLVTNRVAVVEVAKAVARADPDADPSTTLRHVAFVELDAELAQLAAATGGSSLRALDAIHVASAMRLASEIEAFVTYDDRQAVAARSAGFNVEAPTAEGSS